MRPLTEQQFNQLYAGLLARADRLGQTHSTDSGGQRSLRKVDITVIVPGQPGLRDEVRLNYEEWFRRTTLGWIRVRYNYNYFDLLKGGRWGLHLHPLSGKGSTPVPHMVCVWPDGRGEGAHYAAHEIELVAAHELFENHYALEQPVMCAGLTRID